MIKLLRASSFTLLLVIILGVTVIETVDAQETPAIATEDSQPASNDGGDLRFMSESPDDPGALLSSIEQGRTEKYSVFPAAPLKRLHDSADRWASKVEEATNLQLGAAFNHLFMWLSESPLGDDEYGVASELSVLGTWKLANVGEPNQGQLFFQLQGRWQYGPPGPEVLGTENLGSLVGTANTFSEYVPTFLLRNFYWQQGSAEAGWIFRVGKITTDATLSTSAHIASPVTFLPTAGTGPFSNALTDSGLGVAATWFVNDRFKILGIISDANADRFNFGDITEGDFYSAVEFAYKIAPRTERAGYSKLTLWHTDPTKDGQAVNGHLGPGGYGFFLKHEQELTADGRVVAVFRYGRSYNESAVYEEQIGAHFLFYNPTLSGLQNDLLGVAVNWAQANVSAARLESNFEIFYRLPILPNLDMTLSYQSLMNLALDPNNDHASAYGLRFRTTF
jgi:hypothetical protein